MKKEWVLSIKAQCRRANVPFFFKQWGGVRKSLNGRKLDGRTYDEFPDRVHNPVLPADQCLALAAKFEAPSETINFLDVSRLTTRRFEPAPC